MCQIFEMAVKNEGDIKNETLKTQKRFPIPVMTLIHADQKRTQEKSRGK